MLRSQKEEIEASREAFIDYMHPSALRSSPDSRHSQHQSQSPSKGIGSSGRSPYNKYDDPAERDKLIATLLEEHGRSNEKDRQKQQQQHKGFSLSAHTSGSIPSSLATATASPGRTSASPQGEYQTYEESRSVRVGSLGSSDGASGVESYSAAFDATVMGEGDNMWGDESASIGFQGHGREFQRYGLGQDTLFFASDLNASTSGTGSLENSSSAQKNMQAKFSQGDEEAAESISTKGTTREGAQAQNGKSTAMLIYGSYEGEEDSAMYVPESERETEQREVSSEMMATAKAIHSSAPLAPRLHWAKTMSTMFSPV